MQPHCPGRWTVAWGRLGANPGRSRPSPVSSWVAYWGAVVPETGRRLRSSSVMELRVAAAAPTPQSPPLPSSSAPNVSAHHAHCLSLISALPLAVPLLSPAEFLKCSLRSQTPCIPHPLQPGSHLVFPWSSFSPRPLGPPVVHQVATSPSLAPEALAISTRQQDL